MAITDATIPQTTPNSQLPTPNSNDLDLSLDLPPVAPVEATKPAEVDRLKEEDKITQPEVPQIEMPKEETPKVDILPDEVMANTEALFKVEETPASVVLNETSNIPEPQPVPEVVPQPAVQKEVLPNTEISFHVEEAPVSVALNSTDLPANTVDESSAEVLKENLPQEAKDMTLQDDMKIIQDLQATPAVKPEVQERILETKNPEPVNQIPTPSTLNPQQDAVLQPSTMNLDSLLGAPATPVAEVAKSPFDLIAKETPAAQVAQPAVMTTPTTAAQPAIADKNKSVKIGLFVVLFVALGFLTYFIISTMYPMGLFVDSTPVIETPVITGTQIVLTGSETVLTGAEIVATVTTGIELDTGHASADDTNFQDINDLLTEETTAASGTVTQDSAIAQLNRYLDLGNKYLAVSKTQNDLQSMKWSLYLTKKSQALMDKIIANTSTIDSMQVEITTQLAQSEVFLQQLITKYGDLTNTSTQTEPTPTDFMTSE